MSRGPGTWQRGILAALEKQPAVFLADMLPRPHPRAQYVALHRAASQLERAGKIETTRYMCGGGAGGAKLVIHRPGHRFERDQVPRLSVDAVAIHEHINT